MIWVLVVGKSNYDSTLDLSLVARAFGASGITFCPEDRRNAKKIIRSFNSINRNWGGKFAVSFTKNWKKFIDEKKNYLKVYLTRYGIPMEKMEYRIRTYKNILVIVSMKESVKPLYRSADFDLSITTQPHSCASSIAVFLHKFYNGRELAMHFENARYKIVPGEHGIRVEKAR